MIGMTQERMREIAEGMTRVCAESVSLLESEQLARIALGAQKDRDQQVMAAKRAIARSVVQGLRVVRLRRALIEVRSPKVSALRKERIAAAALRDDEEPVTCGHQASTRVVGSTRWKCADCEVTFPDCQNGGSRE